MKREANISMSQSYFVVVSIPLKFKFISPEPGCRTRASAMIGVYVFWGRLNMSGQGLSCPLTDICDAKNYLDKQ